MEDLSIEESSSHIIDIPVFNLGYKQAARGLFFEASEDHVPSDDEAIQDVSMLTFPIMEPLFFDPPPIQPCNTPRPQTPMQDPLTYFSYTLHMLVYRSDFLAIQDLWKNSNSSYCESLNLINPRGDTPLMLAVKMICNGRGYERIFKFLLATGADPSIKDAEGWSVMDEVVIQKNRQISEVLFDYFYREKLQKWVRNKKSAITALRKLPDFYMEIRWEFNSSVIPLVNRIAPHDICKLWKHGSRFRVDSSLVGWKNLRSKRRHMSLFFQPKSSEASIDHEILIVNHQKQIIVRPFEPVDPEEKAAIITDILRTEPLQGDVKLISYKVKQCLSWRGKPLTSKVSEWEATKNKVTYKGQMKYKKKVKNIAPSHESDYFNTEIFEPITTVFSHSGPNELTKSITKKSKAFIWLSQNFPFSLEKFLPVLKLMSETNASMQKFYRFLSDDNLLQNISPSSFPVKVDIPLNMTLKAVITIEKFQSLVDGAELELPRFRSEKRKIAQKILTCPKKRMLLANLVI